MDQYIDGNGRKYTIERAACAAGLGKITKNIHVLYEDGKRAVFPEDVHLKHSKVEQLAQSSPKFDPAASPDISTCGLGGEQTTFLSDAESDKAMDDYLKGRPIRCG